MNPDLEGVCLSAIPKVCHRNFLLIFVHGFDTHA